jgi:tetratricopeptide (TPR) repeat protein
VHRPPFRVAALMIGVAVLALALLAWICLHWTGAQLDAFYGSDGVLAREAKSQSQATAGEEALRLGEYAEAEMHFRSALDLQNSLPPPDGLRDISGVLVGLADALANQGQFDNAERLYRKALEVREEVRERVQDGNPKAWVEWVAEVNRRYAAFLRKRGRLNEAERLETMPSK